MLEVLAIIGLVLLLVLLGMAWCHFCNEGGILGFCMAWNTMDMIGHVMTALLALTASMFSNDS